MKDLNNLDVVFTTPNKKNNVKKITSEFNNNNPLLKAPKKNKVCKSTYK